MARHSVATGRQARVRRQGRFILPADHHGALLGVCAWPSIENVTVPVGVPERELGETIAVKVIAWPGFAGLSEDKRLVVVAAAVAVAGIDGVSTTSSPPSAA